MLPRLDRVLGPVAQANGTERGGFAGITRPERRKPRVAAVASTASRFAIPEVKRALITGAGGLFRLPRTVRGGVIARLDGHFGCESLKISEPLASTCG